MVDQVGKKVVWDVVGIGLVVSGGIIAISQKEFSAVPYMLIGVGLLMVSFEQARGLGDFTVELVKKIKSSLKEDKADPDGQDGEAVKQGVLDEDAPPPDPDEWNRRLTPVLYHASHYSVPTYYLNLQLKVIDWNVAFELVFRDMLGKIRNRHVNYFINELDNKNEVFDHAREFTEKVRHGQLPRVDIEPLTYRSSKYGNANGKVAFVKVATQLNDVKGEQQGWSVALMIRDINWCSFHLDLYAT